jgi:hypothetical protein
MDQGISTHTPLGKWFSLYRANYEELHGGLKWGVGWENSCGLVSDLLKSREIKQENKGKTIPKEAQSPLKLDIANTFTTRVWNHHRGCENHHHRRCKQGASPNSPKPHTRSTNLDLGWVRKGRRQLLYFSPEATVLKFLFNDLENLAWKTNAITKNQGSKLDLYPI